MKSVVKIAIAGFVAACATCATPADAWDWQVTAHVNILEASYTPSLVDFQIDSAAGSCSSGTWLNWTNYGSDEQSQISNAQAVFSLLLTAKLSGQRIWVAGTNSGCTVQFIQIVN